MRSINVEPEFVRPAECGMQKGAHVSIPAWLASAGRDPEVRAEADHHRRRKEWLAQLEHWNQFTHHTPDTLENMCEELSQFDAYGHGSNARLAACMLHPLLAPSYPSTSDVRACLRTGASLTEVRVAEPALRFQCLKCGISVHTAKDARFHCRHAFGHSRKVRTGV